MNHFALFLMIFCFVAIGCGKKTDQDRIAEAQDCLDKATKETASECAGIVDGMTSKASYLIRCVTEYAKEGFTDSSRLQNAMTQIAENSNGSSSMAMMSILAFTSGADSPTNKANVNLAASYCQQSGSKGLTMLASLSATATVVSSISAETTDCASSENPAACIATGMTSLLTSGTDADKAVIGTAAIAAYASNCTNSEASTTNSGLCSQLASTVSSGDSIAVGNILASCYAYCPTADTTKCPSCTGY